MDKIQNSEKTYRPKVISGKDLRVNMQTVLNSPKVAVVEKPEGKYIIFHVVVGETTGEKYAEVATKPHRGLTKEQIDAASDMLHSHQCFTAMFDNVPLSEYYIHTIFYGGEFSEDVKYLSPSFVIAFIEVKDSTSGAFRVGSYDMYKQFLDDTGFGLAGIYNSAIPMLYEGPAEAKSIIGATKLSKLAMDGEGRSAYVLCYPIYDQTNGELQVFVAEGE